jgi:hypothetical protein
VLVTKYITMFKYENLILVMYTMVIYIFSVEQVKTLVYKFFV